MNRSVIALLLIFILALSGCKAQQEAGSATPAERVELDAEAEQKEPLIVPNESDPEEEQPTEDQKEPEEQPTDDEKPVEDEKPTEEANDPEIVKFWETVPEMSIDEAKVIVKAKLERIKSEEKLGTLTDEERMALFVLNCNYYTVKIEQDEFERKYFHTKEDQISLIIQMNEMFDGDTEEYFLKYSWEKELFAQEKLEERRTRYELEPNGTVRINEYYAAFSPYDLGVQEPFYINHFSQGMCIYVDPVAKNQRVNIDDPMPELYRNILKHYLSLKSVAFIEGPVYYSWDPVA